MKALIIFGLSLMLALYGMLVAQQMPASALVHQISHKVDGPAIDPKIKICCQKLPGRFRLVSDQKSNQISNANGPDSLSNMGDGFTYILKRPEIAVDFDKQFWSHIIVEKRGDLH